MTTFIPKNIDFEGYLHQTEEEFLAMQESQNLKWGSYWRDELIDFIEHGETMQGEEMPWPKTKQQFRLREGELTMWAGEDGSRKSMITGQVATWLARKSPVCVISLEILPKVTLYRMCRQMAGCEPSVEYSKAFSTWTDNRVCLYDQIDMVPKDRIRGIVLWSARELGCKHVFIDSLMKCGMKTDDYNEQVDFCAELAQMARDLKIHIHIVHHMKKGEGQGKSRIFGSSQMLNHASNAITVWYNKDRFEALQAQEKGYELSDKQRELIDEKVDQILELVKQRNGTYPHKWGFFFDLRSLQLVESEGKAIRFRIGEPMPDNVQHLAELHGGYEPGVAG